MVFYNYSPIISLIIAIILSKIIINKNIFPKNLKNHIIKGNGFFVDSGSCRSKNLRLYLS